MNNVDNACNYNKQNKTQQMLTALPLPLTKGYAEGQGEKRWGGVGGNCGNEKEAAHCRRTQVQTLPAPRQTKAASF